MYLCLLFTSTMVDTMTISTGKMFYRDTSWLTFFILVWPLLVPYPFHRRGLQLSSVSVTQSVRPSVCPSICLTSAFHTSLCFLGIILYLLNRFKMSNNRPSLLVCSVRLTYFFRIFFILIFNVRVRYRLRCEFNKRGQYMVSNNIVRCTIIVIISNKQVSVKKKVSGIVLLI